MLTCEPIRVGLRANQLRPPSVPLQKNWNSRPKFSQLHLHLPTRPRGALCGPRIHLLRTSWQPMSKSCIFAKTHVVNFFQDKSTAEHRANQREPKSTGHVAAGKLRTRKTITLGCEDLSRAQLVDPIPAAARGSDECTQCRHGSPPIVFVGGVPRSRNSGILGTWVLIRQTVQALSHIILESSTYFVHKHQVKRFCVDAHRLTQF